MLGRVSQRAAAGRLAVEKEGRMQVLMRSMSLLPAKRRLRVVTALPEEDGSFLSHPTDHESVGQLSAVPSTLPCVEPPTPPPSTQTATSLIHRTKKKSLRIVYREPKSTLAHQYKFSPSITPPAPLVALENAILSKKYTDAIEAFQNVPRDDRNRFAYEWVMQAHMALRQYTDVVRLFEEAEKCVPMLHSRIRYHYIVALNRQSRFAEALDAFVDWHMGDVAPLTLHIYNALLVACSHVRDWNAAKTIMDAMTSKAHVNPDGPSYFYLISTAVKCRHEVPPLTALSIAESAAAAGFPISVSLLSHILLDAAQLPSPSSSAAAVPTARRVAALRRALELWDDNKHYDAFTPACEKPCEFALLGMWDAGLHSEAVQVVEDLIALPTPSREFKFRAANMLLTKAAPVNADMSIKLLDLMVAHSLGKLSGPARFRLYAGWTNLLEIEDIAAFFNEYELVTHGWSGARLSDLFVFGFRRFHDKGGKTTVEFKRVMELFTFAFQSGETLTYPALEHAVRWLYEMGKANEALQIIQTMLVNPDLPVGYRLTELGMFIATRLGDPDTVIALFEALQARWQSDKGVELNPKRFVVRMAAKAYSDTGNLIKFQEMRYILTNNEYKHWEGDEVPTSLRRGGVQYI